MASPCEKETGARARAKRRRKDFHLVVISIPPARALAFSRPEKSRRRRISRLENGPAAYATPACVVAHCYELRALNPYFSQGSARAVPLAPPRVLAPRVWRNVTVDVRPDRVAASKTGYGESTKERTIARRDTMGSARRRREGNVLLMRARFAGKETVPRGGGNYNPRRKIVPTHAHVHATRRGAGARTRRDIRGRNDRQWRSPSPPPLPITKSGTISWELAARGDGRLKKLARLLRIATLPNAIYTRRDSQYNRARDLRKVRVCARRRVVIDAPSRALSTSRN